MNKTPRKKLEANYAWRKRNPENVAAQQARKVQKNRRECLEYYGGTPPKCVCCGENGYKFLAVDHINGAPKDAVKLGIRSGCGFYRWLRRNKFPKGFQVLCFNCNTAKGLYGICPHKESLDVIIS